MFLRQRKGHTVWNIATYCARVVLPAELTFCQYCFLDGYVYFTSFVETSSMASTTYSFLQNLVTLLQPLQRKKEQDSALRSPQGIWAHQVQH